MGFISVVEPVVGLHAFTMLMTYPLLQQYVYRRLWEQLGGFPYPISINQSQCSNNYTNFSLHQAVQRETSYFLLKSELFFLFPCLFSSVLLVSYSDYRGRKVAMLPPLVGDFLFTLIYFTVSWYSLSLHYLLGAALFFGLFGGPSTLIGGCFSYVADLCGDEKQKREKTIRMARLEMILGVMSGLGSLCTGFYIQAAGFSWPFLTVSVINLLNLFYVLVVLKEPHGHPGQNITPDQSLSSPEATAGTSPPARPKVMTSQIYSVYLLFAVSTQRRKMLLLIMLTAFVFYKVAKLGGMSLFLLYELNPPLCWSEVLIGYGFALSALIHLSSFAGVWLLSRWLSDGHITLLGLLSLAAGFLMTAFANTSLLMFLVRLPLLLSIMPAPVMRSMISKLVTNSEQGAAFACVALMEMLSIGMEFPVFSSIYAGSISWFAGLSFIIAAGLTLIPAILIGAVLWLRLDVKEDSLMLITEDNSEANSGSVTLQLSP